MIRNTVLLVAILILIGTMLVSPDWPTASAQPSAIATLVASGDTYLKGGTPNTNQGASTFVRAQESGPNRGLVRFSQSEIRAAINDGTLVSVKLRMTIVDNGNNWGTTGRTVDIHRVLVDWTEGNGANGEGATWNCPKDTNIANSVPDGLLWRDMGPPYKDGGSYLATLTSTVTITNEMSGTVEWTVTADVATFLAGTANYGWIIRKTDEASPGRVDFASKENSVISSRPQLVIAYIHPISKIVFTTSPQTLIAGLASTLMTIQTQDASGNPINVTSDTTITLSSTSDRGKFSLSTGPWIDVGSLTITAGSNSVSFYYKDTVAGIPAITTAESPSQGWTDATQQETVNPAAVLDHFTMSGYPSSTAAGQNFGSNNIIVAAYDVYGNVKTDYTGQVYFTSTDPQAVLPYTSGSRYTFTTGVGGDNGMHTFAGTGFILKTLGSQTITLTDGTKSVTSSSITVKPSSLDHFTFATISSPQTAGSAFTITITAKDQYENTVTSYTGSNTLSDSTGTIIPASAGVISGTWTGSVTITKAQTGVTITTSGGSKSGTSNTFNVNSAGGNKLVITVSPSSVTAGSWSTVYTVQRQDQYGNPYTSGSTTVTLASSSTGVNKKFAETSGGPSVTSVTIPDGSSTRVFYYYDEKAGSWIISVSAMGLAGDSKSLTVNPGILASFTMSGYPSSVTAGQSFGSNNVVVAAYDAYNNVKTDYTGQVWFTSSDLQAVLPYISASKHAFTTGDNGVHTFAGTGFSLKTAGSQTLTVTDGTVSVTSSIITVVLAPVSIVITTSPAGSGFVKVDGSSIDTPQTFAWAIGSTHTLEALSPVTGDAGIQYVWVSWSDGGGQTHTYTAPSSSGTVTAEYGLPTSTGSGVACLTAGTGTLTDVSTVSESSLPSTGKPDFIFPDGFFSFKVTDLEPGDATTVTITLPSAVPVGTQYWKYGPTPTDATNHWYQLPMGDDNGDNVITITLVDGGLGDGDLTANGVIVDPGGPGVPLSPALGPVGGTMYSVNKPAVLLAYLALVGVVGAAVLAIRRRQPVTGKGETGGELCVAPRLRSIKRSVHTTTPKTIPSTS